VVTFKDGPLRAGIEQLGIPVEILPRRKHSVVALPLYLAELWHTRRALLGLVRKYSVDVIQTHLLRSLDFLVLSLRLEANARIFWTFHNARFELREEHLARNKWLFKPKLWGYNLLYSLGARAVNRIIAVSEEVETSIHQTLPGIPSEKVTTISNSVDVSRYGMLAGRSALRRELGLCEGDVVAAVVATFKEQKGHRFLLDALPEVLKKHTHFKVLLIGDGELRAGLQVHAMTLRLEKNVLFLGSRGDVPALLAASDLFILPSLWEGLPMALIEAMATGLPSIATTVSGTNQVMNHGETGLLVAPGDSRELTGAMLELLSNPECMREMGRAARRRVEVHFGAQRQAQEHLDLFSSELGRLSAVRA
jgi:glycosyltransferase involved in cell wall biosynthesis